MKVKDLIRELLKRDQELEVVITDGYEAICYHTNAIEIKDFSDEDGTVVDIGIGGCKIANMVR